MNGTGIFAQLGEKEVLEKQTQKFNHELSEKATLEIENSDLPEIQIRLEKINFKTRFSVFG